MVRLFVFQVLRFLAARLLQPLAERAGLPALMVVEVQPRRPASTPLVDKLEAQTALLRYRTKLTQLDGVLWRALANPSRCGACPGCMGPQ